IWGATLDHRYGTSGPMSKREGGVVFPVNARSCGSSWDCSMPGSMAVDTRFMGRSELTSKRSPAIRMPAAIRRRSFLRTQLAPNPASNESASEKLQYVYSGWIPMRIAAGSAASIARPIGVVSPSIAMAESNVKRPKTCVHCAGFQTIAASANASPSRLEYKYKNVRSPGPWNLDGSNTDQ